MPLSALDAVRERIRQIEAADRVDHGALAFGVAKIDTRLPHGGLALGALHEVAGGGNGAVHGAAAALFTAGIMARTTGKILWCVTRRDLFAPALAQAGLHPDRVVYAEVGGREVGAGLFRGGFAAWQHGRCRRRGCQAVDGGVASACSWSPKPRAHRRSPSGAGGA